jgi:polysaccharide biosynthesis protein PslJ
MPSGRTLSAPGNRPALDVAVSPLGHHGPAPAGRPQQPPSGGRWLARHPEWPVVALLAGYPLWWALGVADFAWIGFAVPMAGRMLAWRLHRSRPVRLPPGMGLWAVFLLFTVAGIVVLSLTAPGTLPSPMSHRAVSWTVRTGSYLALTVLLLYVGNLTEAELPRRRLAGLIGVLALYATVLGVAAMALPEFSFTSPAELVLPAGIRSNTFIQASMHPALAQIQDVFGTPGGQSRPKAPFDYTNIWGECLTLSLPWLLLAVRGRGQGRDRRGRLISGVVLAAALIVLVDSLNRGVWLGVLVAVAYLAVRLAARGRLTLLGGMAAGLAALAVLVLVSPLHGVISQRLANGKSNTIRMTLSTQAVEDALASPVLGYGDTRQRQGSANSISIGPTPACPQCGQQQVGSTGQLWLLLITSGFAGTLLYVAFFARLTWEFRRDPTPYGLAGGMVLLLSFFYLPTYDALPAPLGITILSVALLWRSDQNLRSTASGPGQE